MPALWKTTSSSVRSKAEPEPLRQIALDGRDWPVRIVRHARARRLTLRFDGKAGELRLTVPRGASVERALAWAAEQRSFLRAQIDSMGERIVIGPGAVFPYMGEEIAVVWDAGKRRTPELRDGILHVGGPEAGVGRRIERWLRAEALAILSDETRHYAGLGGLQAGRVSVADPSSRWGSCSSDGSIRYSWRLIMAPDLVRRSTVAHEVAHLKHMHHGPEFHAFVDTIFEDNARKAKRWLKAHGAGLHRYRFE